MCLAAMAPALALGEMCLSAMAPHDGSCATEKCACPRWPVRDGEMCLSAIERRGRVTLRDPRRFRGVSAE